MSIMHMKAINEKSREDITLTYTLQCAMHRGLGLLPNTLNLQSAQGRGRYDSYAGMVVDHPRISYLNGGCRRDEH